MKTKKLIATQNNKLPYTLCVTERGAGNAADLSDLVSAEIHFQKTDGAVLIKAAVIDVENSSLSVELLSSELSSAPDGDWHVAAQLQDADGVEVLASEYAFTTLDMF